MGRRRNRTGWILLALIAIGALALWFYQTRPPPLAVVEPERGAAVQAVYATGTVEASVMLPIAPRVAAHLSELDVDEGQSVKKGQQLARLEDTDLTNALAQLRAQERFARNEFERDTELFHRQVIARTTWEQARAAWQAAAAASARAAAERGYARLSAPADGILIRRDGEIGQMIAANQPLFWLAVASPPRISAEVDEEDIPSVQVGQKVLVRADAFPGSIFRAHVQAITPKGDATARSYRVRIGFDEPTSLRIGMTIEANIVVREHDDALLLPSEAVRNGRVWIVVGGRLHSKTVSTGILGNGRVEIVDGLRAADRVVALPTDSLREGERVQARVQARDTRRQP